MSHVSFSYLLDKIGKIYYGCNKEDGIYTGFRGDGLHRELGLFKGLRSIPVEQLMRGDAVEVFKKWKEKKDKLD